MRSFSTKQSEQIGQFVFTVEHHHEVDQAADDGGFVPLAAQLVIDAVEPFRGGIQPFSAAALHDDRAPIDEAFEQGGYAADVQAGAPGDFAGTRRSPEIDHREIHPALGFGEAFQVAAEILGVVVDQGHQFLHQLAQGTVAREVGHDDQQAGVAAGQDLERPDLAAAVFAADHLPHAPTLLGVQRFQADGAEQLEERLVGVVQPREPAGGRSEQHDPWFRLQRLAQLPAEIVIHVPTERLQILDHEDELFVQPVRGVQYCGPGAVFQVFPGPTAGQVGLRGGQFPRQVGVGLGGFPREVEQRLQPEVAHVEDFLAFFHEPDRQQPFGQCGVRAHLRGDARQQHGLAAATGGDEQDMLARRRIEVVAHDVQHEAEFALPDDELPDHFVIGLERARIELAKRRFVRLVHYPAFLFPSA